jgi:organic radical activating enzyme
MNDQNTFSAATLNDALNAHSKGKLQQALVGYEQCLAIDANEPLALYGAATIRLSQGNISAYPAAVAALFNGRTSTLDKSLAAESVVRILLMHQYQDHARRFLKECEKNAIIPNNLQALKKSVEIPAYLKTSTYDPLLERELERYRPIESSEHYVYAIDIVGGCNLRCPTCPVSNQDMPKGLMSLELYQSILQKIQAECIDSQPDIWLFNWTEPLLHPQVEQFIEATHAFGMTSFLSTNLNLGGRIEAVMRAKPTRLKVSLSSLQQSIYGKTHARGDIATVIDNLHALAKWRDHYQSPTHIWIGHHLYRNTIAEQNEVKALADKLGFGYAPSPAIVAPLERVMRMARAQEDDVDGMREQLLYDPLQLQQANAQRRSGRKDCELRFNMTTIAHDGMVNLCCATTQTLAKKPVAFLDHSHEELEDMKYRNSFCKQCMKANLHLTISDC